MVDEQQQQAVGEACISVRIFRVELDCLLELLPRARDCIERALIQVGPALHVKIVGRETVRRDFGKPAALFFG